MAAAALRTLGAWPPLSDYRYRGGAAPSYEAPHGQAQGLISACSLGQELRQHLTSVRRGRAVPEAQHAQLQVFGQCLQLGPGVRWAFDFCELMSRQALKLNMLSCSTSASACNKGQGLHRAFYV